MCWGDVAGVLLLNAVLTVEERKSNSHANVGWEQFTDAVLAHVAKSALLLLFGR